MTICYNHYDISSIVSAKSVLLFKMKTHKIPGIFDAKQKYPSILSCIVAKLCVRVQRLLRWIENNQP